MFDDLESADIDTLRRLAVVAWQRAEALEVENAIAVEEKAKAVEEKAKAVREKKVVQAKLDALLTENEVLLARIAKLTLEIARSRDRDTQLALELELTTLRTQLANSNDQAYGSRTERRPRDNAAKDKKAAKGHGPTDQPNLPIESVVCELDDCTCGGCGGDLRILSEQFEESELISSVRRSFVLKEVKRQKYACGGCGTLCAAPGPLRLVPGGRYDIAFGVQVALDKYLDAMPLERQVRKMRRVKLDVTSTTLWDQLHILYLLLLPSFLALQERVRAEDVLHIDETRWRMMGKGEGRSKTWWLWVLAGANGIVFDLQPSRGSEACKALLDGFAGTLVADGYGVYSSLEKAFSHNGEQLSIDGNHLPQPDFLLAMCWMHARRGFIKAEKKGAVEASEALDLIGEIYAVEALAKERADGDPVALLEHRSQLRSERSVDLVSRLEVWCAAQRVLPGTQLHQAIEFVKARWPSLKVFLTNPLVPVDNGEAERQIRGPVVGRKNYYGTRSERGARVASLMFSMIQTCTTLGVDPHGYLTEAATRARRMPGTVYLPHEHPTTSSQDQPTS